MPIAEEQALHRALESWREMTARLAADTSFAEDFAWVAMRWRDAVVAGRKLLIVGNGGSASQAQHLAAEWVGRFGSVPRPALPALALSADGAVLTALANDYGYDSVFSRQVEALGQPGDILVAFSTSGRSPNLHSACQAARTRDLTIVSFLGATPGPMAELSDRVLCIPSSDPARVQEGHLMLVHALCAEVEAAIVAQ